MIRKGDRIRDKFAGCEMKEMIKIAWQKVINYKLCIFWRKKESKRKEKRKTRNDKIVEIVLETH